MKQITAWCAGLLTLAVLSSSALADKFWGDGSPDWGAASPALFRFDTISGTVETTYTYSDWSWIMDVEYAPGNILYAVHNTTADVYDFKLAKVDASTGTVLSDTLLNTLTGTDYPTWNALQYYNGKLYGIENNSWGSGYSAGLKRGYVYETTLAGNGDPLSVTLGAYMGPAPDGALAYRNGTFYASDWKSDTSSWIKTSTDIMNTNFSGTVGTSPGGFIAGWDFENDGDLLGVSWNNDFNVYKIDLATGSETALYNLQSQLPGNLTMYGGLTIPEPSTIAQLGLAVLALLILRSRRAS